MNLILPLLLLLFSTTPPTLPEQQITVDGKAHTLVWTVDDHPCKETDQFLDIFNQKKIKATFFLVGYALQAYYQNPKYSVSQKRFAAIQRVHADGHTIGNHALTHLDLCAPGFPAHRVRFEIKTTQDLIVKATGFSPWAWRPPHGKICKAVYQEVNRAKLVSFLWDVADWRTTPARMAFLLKRRVSLGETKTILLFHRDPKKLLTFMSLLGI